MATSEDLMSKTNEKLLEDETTDKQIINMETINEALTAKAELAGMDDSLIDTGSKETLIVLLSSPACFPEDFTDEEMANVLILREFLMTEPVPYKADVYLEEFPEIMPFVFIIPSVRMELGFVVYDDVSCVRRLNEFKKFMEDCDMEETWVVDNLIKFVQNEVDSLVYQEMTRFFFTFNKDENLLERRKWRQCHEYLETLCLDHDDEVEDNVQVEDNVEDKVQVQKDN